VITSGEKCIEREDFYLSCFSHEYNILEKAGSTLGSTRNNTGEKNPMFGKNHSDESKKIMSPSFGGMLKKGRIILIMVKKLKDQESLLK